MVTAGRAVRWTQRMLHALGTDLRAFREEWSGSAAVQSGLHAYQIYRPGEKRRLHLRVHADGSAVLFVDVTDAIHLNPTAALLVHSILQGATVDRAAARLRRRFRGVSREESRRQAVRIHAMIDRLTTGDGCPTCGLSDIEWHSPFSIPVSAPYKADLALRYGCNNACPHCYSEHRNRELQQDARPSLDVSQWSETLERLAAVGIPYVIFTGGEPTLFEGLADLIRKADGLGLIAGLNTNGRRLSDARFAASLQTAGLNHVQITLESDLAEVHNAMTGAASFDETVQGIQNALAVGLHTITNTTLTRQNADRAGQLVDFLHALGLRTFAANGIIRTGGGRTTGDALLPETLAPVLALVRDRARSLKMRFLWYTPTEYCRLSPVELELGPRRCNAGEYSICIEPNGDVLPCQSYYAPVGNILRDPWEEIWENELFRGFRSRTADPRAAGLPEYCWSCTDLPLCGGGCGIEREFEQRTGKNK